LPAEGGGAVGPFGTSRSLRGKIEREVEDPSYAKGEWGKGVVPF